MALLASAIISLECDNNFCRLNNDFIQCHVARNELNKFKYHSSHNESIV